MGVFGVSRRVSYLYPVCCVGGKHASSADGLHGMPDGQTAASLAMSCRAIRNYYGARGHVIGGHYVSLMFVYLFFLGSEISEMLHCNFVNSSQCGDICTVYAVHVVT